MTTLQLESSFSQDALVNSVKRMAVAVPVGHVSHFATEDSHEDWQSRIRGMQQWSVNCS
jgi:hypothetical protein